MKAKAESFSPIRDSRWMGREEKSGEAQWLTPLKRGGHLPTSTEDPLSSWIFSCYLFISWIFHGRKSSPPSFQQFYLHAEVGLRAIPPQLFSTGNLPRYGLLLSPFSYPPLFVCRLSFYTLF